MVTESTALLIESLQAGTVFEAVVDYNKNEMLLRQLPETSRGLAVRRITISER